MAQIRINGQLNIRGRTSLRDVSLWSPAVLDPILWLDATQLDTLTIDAGRVDEWRDAMGSGRRVTNSNDANRPEYTATINGVTVPTFNGAGYGLDTSLDTADFNAWRALPYQTEMLTFAIINWFGGSSSIKTLWQPPNNTVSYTPTLRIDTGTPPKRLTSLIGGVNAENVGNSTAILFGVNTGTNTIGTGVHIVGIWAKDDIHYMHTNGEEWNTTNYSTTNLGSPLGIRIGRSSQDVGDRHFEGGFGEFIHVRSNVSLANVQRIEGYLAHKWGQSALLPIGHPYKDAAPLA